jgi:hypothetical protein
LELTFERLNPLAVKSRSHQFFNKKFSTLLIEIN